MYLPLGSSKLRQRNDAGPDVTCMAAMVVNVSDRCTQEDLRDLLPKI
jgi:hypothetical protein